MSPVGQPDPVQAKWNLQEAAALAAGLLIGRPGRVQAGEANVQRAALELRASGVYSGIPPSLPAQLASSPHSADRGGRGSNVNPGRLLKGSQVKQPWPRTPGKIS